MAIRTLVTTCGRSAGDSEWIDDFRFPIAEWEVAEKAKRAQSLNANHEALMGRNGQGSWSR
jgi:hypothetical protein